MSGISVCPSDKAAGDALPAQKSQDKPCEDCFKCILLHYNKPSRGYIQNGLTDGKMLSMKKWEYKLLVQLWDSDKGRFYWADHERDPRNAQERLDALNREGWETVSAFPSGIQGSQRNYLLRRAGES